MPVRQTIVERPCPENRDQLLDGDVARLFLDTVLTNPAVKTLLSNDRFSVDGTLIEAWASMQNFQPKDGRLSFALRAMSLFARRAFS
jgi:hypothetical protein